MSIRITSVMLSQDISSHSGMKGRIQIGENIAWMQKLIESVLRNERERYAEIADKWETLDYKTASGIAKEIRGEE